MMPHRRAASLACVLIAAATCSSAVSAWECRPASVNPLILEVGPSEARVRYVGVQAQVRIGAEAASQEQMEQCAQRLFDSSLASEADRVPGANLIFVTFLLGEKPVGGKNITETYRAIFLKESGAWTKMSAGSAR